jgi:preprotein translocase subunit SecG
VYNFLTILHVIVCIFLMLVVLLQAGRGGGMGIAFGGSGGSQSVFGSSGGANFLTKMTAVCAFIFFANSMTLAYMSSQSDSRRLQKIAAKKAADKKAEDATKAKLAGALEKAREEAEKAKSVLPEGATASVSATATDTNVTDEKPVAPAKASVQMAVPEKSTLKLKLTGGETTAPVDKPAPVKKAVRASKPAPTEEAAPAEKTAPAEGAAPAATPVRIKKATPPEKETPVAPTPAQP